MFNFAYTISVLKEFFSNAFKSFEEASISSNMQVEGYTDFEIELVLNDIRENRDSKQD